MKLNCIIKKQQNNFNIDLKHFSLYNTDLVVSGYINIDKNNLSKIDVSNLVLQFDKKMQLFKAKKLFVTRTSKQIDLKFVKQTYKDVDLTNSTASYIIDKKILKLYLKTKSQINQTLLKALARYNVVLPLTQYSGTNNIQADIFIPFTKKQKLYIKAKVTIKDGKLKAYNQDIDLDNLLLNYENKKLFGWVDIKQVIYNNVAIQTKSVYYNVDLSQPLKAKIKAQDIQAKIANQVINLTNLDLNLTNNKLTASCDILHNHKKFAFLTNTTDLVKKQSKGSLATISFRDKNIAFNSKKIFYNLDFNNQLIATAKSKLINLDTKIKLQLKNPKITYKQNKLNIDTIIYNDQYKVNFHLKTKIDLTHKNIQGVIQDFLYNNNVHIKIDKIPYKIDYQNNLKVSSAIQQINITNPTNIVLKDTKFHLQNNIGKLQSSIAMLDHNLTTKLTTNINILSKKITGALLDTTMNNKNIAFVNKQLNYQIDYKNNPIIKLDSNNLIITKPKDIILSKFDTKFANNNLSTRLNML